jgi:hypothetical protein
MRAKRNNAEQTVTVRVPLSIRQRGGRKLVIGPHSVQPSNAAIADCHLDNALIKAIARAFRWRDLLESGQYSTIRKIAAADSINETYVGRILRLSLLAPDLVERALERKWFPENSLEGLLRSLPVTWSLQRDIVDLTGDRLPAIDAGTRD